MDNFYVVQNYRKKGSKSINKLIIYYQISGIEPRYNDFFGNIKYWTAGDIHQMVPFFLDNNHRCKLQSVFTNHRRHYFN